MDSRDDPRLSADGLVGAARPIVDNVLVFRRIDSTHACALRMIEQAEAEEVVLPATLIIAGEQERGQGRAGRSWVSPPGGLYLSWLAAGIAPETVAQLPMIAAAAAHEAVVRLGIERAVIKWPNDLLVDGRKLAGLLFHARHGTTTWVVISIGVNLIDAPSIPDDHANPTAAVADFVPGGDRRLWAESLVKVFTRELHDGIDNPTKQIARWRERLAHREGDEMVVRRGDGSEICGRFVGLTDEGHLRLEAEGTEHRISAGDVIE
jgi:BirA family biotin operon repressor/biotin-[acetyl-CoA-carboxylase] ligase